MLLLLLLQHWFGVGLRKSVVVAVDAPTGVEEWSCIVGARLVAVIAEALRRFDG
jgi:hypothetical protein